MNLVALFEEALEFQNFNGTVLSNGKVKVYHIGRTSLADIYNDVAGEYPSENPKILDNLGMGPIYVNPAFDYEIVVYDEYDNELFSVKKYLHSNGAHSTANVEVVPSENIQVSAWTVGEVQIYQPYITGSLGKVYSGVEPIVVNNDEDKISANHVALGLQEPLYFVEDSESACIIGCSAQSEIPSAISGKWEDAADTVSTNSAQWGAGANYSAGDYVDITDGVISVTGLQVAGDYAYNSALSSKLDTTAFSTVSGDFLTAVDLTPYQEKSAMSGYITTGDSAQFYTNDNPSGFITGVDLSDYATTRDLANKLDTTAFSNVSGDFITALPEDLVYTGDLNDYAKKDFVLSSIDSSTSGLLPTSSFSSVSGSFLTALPSDLVYTADITGLATTADLTSKLDKSDSAKFYTTANESGFITGIPDEVTNAASTVASNSANWDSTYNTVSTNSASWTASTIPSEVTAAASAVSSNSANWNSTYNTVTANSADWSVSEEISGTNGIKISESADKVIIEVSASYATEDWVTGQGYLTAHQSLEDYQTTAGMTAYQPAGAYLTTADSANFYTTANESGFISEVPAGTMNESAFEYDANDKISGYNGSAFAGGSELPQSATEAIETVTTNSADWNETTETVSSNSGVWGGSALPISAGPGIKFEMVDNTLVASTDETVLWSGYYTPTNGTNITFTEPVSAFNEIKFVAQGHYSFIPEEHIFEFSASEARTIPLVFNGVPEQGGIRINSCIGTFSSNYMRLDIANCRQHSIEGANTTIITGNNNSVITKVVGINRIAGGN